MTGIKFGAHTYIWREGWSDDHLDLLDRGRELGLDCIEIALGDDVTFTPALLARRARTLGLELFVSPGGAWPMHLDLSDDDPGNRRLGLAWHQHNVDLAAEAGASIYAGALYGHPGRVLRRRPPADEYPRTAEGLHALADYAARRGIGIVLEPMSRFRTHVVNTPQQAMRLLELADHPNLSLLLDTYHMVTEVRDYAAAIRTLLPRFWGIHACESDRGVPGGGLVPWQALFAALGESKRPVRVLLESYNSSEGDFAFRRGIFQDLCPDGDQFVRQGIAFLKDCWSRSSQP